MSERSSQPPHIEQPPPSLIMGGERVSMQVAADMDLAHERRAPAPGTEPVVLPAMRRLLRHRLAMGSLVVLLFLGVVAIFADFAPYPFDEPDFLNVTQPPTLEGKHYFGTDFLGRDTNGRVIYGMRTSLWVALVVSLLATVIGTTIGAAWPATSAAGSTTR